MILRVRTNDCCNCFRHREMLDSVLHTFNIKPHYDLNIMEEGQTLSDITSRAMTKLEDVIKKRPDMVLVHGDTTTTFSGALVAFIIKLLLVMLKQV